MLELHKVSGDDEPFLRALFAAGQPVLAVLSALPDGLGEHLLTMQYEARRAQYHSRWPEAVHQVIDRRDGDVPCPQAVGALWADHGADAIHVLDIAVLPAWRGQGIGTRCLQDLLTAAARRHLPVTLQVAFDNPARRLYERLGFVPAGAADGVNLQMICQPPSPPARRNGGVARPARPRARLHAEVPTPHLTEKCHEQA